MESVSIKHETVDKAPERKAYIALVPMIKNGKKIRKGSKVQLDAETAARFKELGEIKNA